MSENKDSNTLSAFLLGGVIGAVLGILFAPAKGKDTREKVNDWVEDATEKAKEKIGNAKEKLENLEEEIKKRKEQLFKQN